MDTKKSEHSALSTKTPSAQFLYAKRNEILDAWMKRVKAEVATAAELLNPVVIDTIPLFLDGLSEALCEECTRETATESSNMAQEHGGERARVTRYGPEQIIQEYQILQNIVRHTITAVIPLHETESDIIQKSFDKALQEAMISFFLVHGRLREQFVAGLTHDLRNPIGGITQLLAIMDEEQLEPKEEVR